MDSTALTGGTRTAGGKSGTQLWKTNDVKANKTGPRHTVFWVKGNEDFKESKRLGVPAPKGAGPYKTGVKYAGEWVDNRKEGYGTLTTPSGDKFEGEWLDNKRHGRGTQWVRRGGKLRKLYTGDWVMGKRTGSGVYFYKDGSRYEGEWMDNKRHGRGRMEYASGDVYDGEWVDDQRAGVGVLVLSNGDQFEGHFAADKKEGPGRLFYMTTKKMYEGEWVDDVAKCGVFSDIPAELLGGEGRGAAGEDQFRLPELGLEDPDGVIVDAVEAACRWRASQGTSGGGGAEGAGAGGAEATMDDLTPEEVGQLRDAFSVVDSSGSGEVKGANLPAVLAHLGIAPSEDALSALLDELRATRDSMVSFRTFADCMARLRE